MLSRFTTLALIAYLIPACATNTDTDPNDPADEIVVQEPDFALTQFLDNVNVCSAAEPGEAACHAHVLVFDGAKPFATTAPSGFGPSDLRSAYAITSSGSSSTTIAIVDAFGYPNAESDLGTYRSQFGLPACTTANGCFKKVSQTGSTTNLPRANTGWEQESALDLDMASAMCPNCKILLVEASSSSIANLATSVNRAATMGAHVISNSYGGSESSTNEASYNHSGVAVTASSGDSGFGVQFPASSPHVVAVGGTSLSRASNARGWTETVWNGAGSGCSTVFAKPTWQHDSGCAKRTVTDVSAIADPNTGVAVFGPPGNNKASTWMVFGGTSVAAPLIGGIYAANGGTVTFGSDPYAHTSALNDVTSGSNSSNGCSPAYLCTGEVGYDGPTGLGTPIGTTAF